MAPQWQYPNSAPNGASLPAFCRVTAVATPSEQSHINIEVWLPLAERWNGRLLGMANGGFSGAIPYAAMAEGLARGYATVGTDTGHNGDQMEFGFRAPERIVDWSYRAVHLMTVSAKTIVQSHFGKTPAKSYFNGCSTGGQQALSEAQRFPDDYDGIVAGAPGNNRRRLILGFLWSWAALHKDGKPIVSPAQLALVAREFVAACDARDGIEDGLVDDPRACSFDLAALGCRGEPSDQCLSDEQITAVRSVHRGAQNVHTQEPVFSGWVPGSEAEWGTYLLHPHEPMRLGFFKYFVYEQPQWDWRTFNWDSDLAHVYSKVPELDATSHDLTRFRERGGKLLMYTGWADPVVPATDTVSYYERVVRASGGSDAARQFIRFFAVPGMAHCGGGDAPNQFDALGAIEQWVEQGHAPDLLIASQISDGSVVRTRPVCAWPDVARYQGKGDTRAAESFECASRGESPGTDRR
jgi:feruloyl esterase